MKSITKRHWRRFTGYAAKSGSAAIELSLVAPLLIFSLLALMDFGLAIHDRMQLVSAARAGVQYAMHHNTDTDDVRLAVLASLTIDPATVEVSVDRICKCPGDTYMPCNGSCYPERMRTYIEIHAQTNYTPLFDYPLIPKTIILQSAAHARVH